MRRLGLIVGILFLQIPVACFNPKNQCADAGSDCGAKVATSDADGPRSSSPADAIDADGGGDATDLVSDLVHDLAPNLDGTGGSGGQDGSGGAGGDAGVESVDADAAMEMPDTDVDGGDDTPDVTPDGTGGSGGGGMGGGGTGGGGDGTGGSTGDCTADRTSPPTMVCQGAACLTLPDAVRAGLTLWLDPSNIGPIGSSVATWCDQSGKMNDAFAINMDALPQVISGGLSLAYGMQDAAFVVPDSPTIDLGADDFLILVVAGISHGTEAKSFFRKFNDDTTFPKEVALDWLFSDAGFKVTGHVNETPVVSTIVTTAGTDRLYGLRRSGDQIEVRINNQIVSTAPLATPGASTQNNGDVFLGEFGYGSPRSIDTLRAVVVVRGALDSNDVGQLETYLMTAFGL